MVAQDGYSSHRKTFQLLLTYLTFVGPMTFLMLKAEWTR